MLLSHPAFQLFSAALYDTIQQSILQKVFLPNMKEDERFKAVKNIDEGSLPVGLRWTMHPELGFPRKPFEVFRRRATYDPARILRPVNGGNETVNIIRSFYFGNEMFVMAVSCNIPAGQSIKLTPLGRDNVLMRAKTFTLTSSGTTLFKAPFMIGVLCEGMGSVTNLAGVTMQSVIDATDWEKIQIVGFPFRPGDVGGLGYNSDPQGFVSALTSGVEAAKMRLKMGEWLFIPTSSINAVDAQCDNVSWNHPEADAYLNMLGNEQLKYIRECLTQSDDLSFDRNQRQISYRITQTIKGISQTGSSLPPKPAELSIPVVNHTLLSVSNESPAALGLGFGTYDFVPIRLAQPGLRDYTYMSTHQPAAAAGHNFLGFDYMVTAEYTIRPFEDFPFSFLDDLSKNISFCALNDERAAPVTPTQLEVMGIQQNRPAAVDQPFTESVKIRWQQGHVQHGFGMVANYNPGPSHVLNDPYDFDADIYKNFFTPVPRVSEVEQDLDDIGKFVLTETDEPVPLFGTELHKYFIAGWDLFGRWTGWIRGAYNAVAPPPQQPGIMAIRLQLADPENIQNLTPTQAEVDAILEIDFGWDWIDRTPAQIQIAGRFFNAGLTNPPAGTPNFFSLGSGDSTTPVIQINFASTNPATVPTCSLGTVHIMEQTPSGPPPPGHPQFGSSDVPSNNLKRYKLIIPNVRCSFPGGAPYEVAYAAYIRGMERIRIPITGFSPWASGYITRIADPRPPQVTTLPATVLFTAVPDATRLGRGRLSWPSATGALAYHLWEASETAIRATLDSLLRTEFPGDETQWLRPLSDPLVDRATQLRNLLAQAKYMNPCQRSFNKLTKDPVQATSYELALPGGSDVLYLYQVSSVNSGNIESAKSNVVFYAVPKVIKPAAPLLQVRPYKKRTATDPDGEGIEVKVVNTIGDEPLGYTLYRTRKKIFGNDVGMKGLPVYEHTATQWDDTSIQLLDGTTFIGKQVRELSITRSWRPYVYQAVAIGRPDPARGKLSGESEGSTTEIIYFPPGIGPTLLSGSISNNAFSSRFVLTTTAPFDKVDLGKTIIELYTLDTDNRRTFLRSFVAHESPRSSTVLPLAPSSSAANELPRINHQSPDTSTGVTQFSVCVKGATIDLIIKIIDPLNRATEIKLGT